MRLRRYVVFLCSRTGPPAHIPCQFNTKSVFTFRLLSLPSKSLYPHTLADHFYVRRHPQVTILTLHQSSIVSRQFSRVPGHPTRSPFLPSSLFALTCITTPHTTLHVSFSCFVGHAMVLCLSYTPSNKLGQARLKDF